MIAGTGRAGTSFLVHYLTELGLSTSLSANPGQALDPLGNAGFEDLPLAGCGSRLPYVIKSPWMSEYVDELLQRVDLDGVIIPVRDLADATTSRLVVEREAMHRAAPWLDDHAAPWNSWGWVPGGAVFSLEPIDQMRLLAVGFHHLVERLVRAEVRIVFVSFPRIVTDAEYLADCLAPLLPRVSRQSALAAHARVANAAMVRVRPAPDLADRSRDLDRMALSRQAVRLRAELDAIHASVSWRLLAGLRVAARRALRRLRRLRTLLTNARRNRRPDVVASAWHWP
jgi:hypothetical protein